MSTMTSASQPSAVITSQMCSGGAEIRTSRSIRSVANRTREDGHEFLALAPEVPVVTTITTYPLAQAERALADLRAGAFEGTAVLLP